MTFFSALCFFSFCLSLYFFNQKMIHISLVFAGISAFSLAMIYVIERKYEV
jgi:hypothetical protein